MDAPSREAFADAFRQLEPDDRREFIAHLWRHRGISTTVLDDGVSVGSDPSRRVVLVGRWPRGPSDAELVIALWDTRRARRYARDRDAHYWTLDDVYTVLFYGIERHHAKELCRRFFGVSFDEMRTGNRVPVRLSGRLVAGVLILVILGAVAIGGLGAVLTDSHAEPEQLTVEPGSEVGSISAELRYLETHPGVAAFGPTYPTGLSPNGVYDPDALVETHRERLGDRPHRLSLTYLGPTTDPLFPGATRVNKTIIKGMDSSVIISERMVVNDDGSESRIVVGEYRDGTERINWIERADTITVFEGESLLEPSLNPHRPMPPAEWYRGVLTAPETDVRTVHRDGALHHRIEVEGQPERRIPAADHFSGTATLTAGGRLVELSMIYMDPESDERVLVTMEYGDYPWGEEVAPPPWVSDNHERTHT